VTSARAFATLAAVASYHIRKINGCLSCCGLRSLSVLARLETLRSAQGDMGQREDGFGIIRLLGGS